MIILKVDGLEKTQLWLQALAQGELRFGLAKGLTALAQKIQTVMVEETPKRFTVRTGWYKPNTPYGWKITKATKQDLVSEVFSRAPWLPLQESGGIKRVTGKRLAIPTDQVRRTKRDLIAASQKPQRLQKAFPLKLKSGKSMLAMWQGRGKSRTLKFLYTLSPEARVPARLHFEDTALQVIAREGSATIAEGIRYAIDTSRR